MVQFSVKLTDLRPLKRPLRPVELDTVKEWYRVYKERLDNNDSHPWVWPPIPVAKGLEGKKEIWQYLDGQHRVALARDLKLKEIPATEVKAAREFDRYAMQLNFNLNGPQPPTIAQRDKAIKVMYAELLKDKTFLPEAGVATRQTEAKKLVVNAVSLSRMSIWRILTQGSNKRSASRVPVVDPTPTSVAKSFIAKVLGLNELYHANAETMMVVIRAGYVKDPEIKGACDRLVALVSDMRERLAKD